MRQYEPIWVALKKTKTVAITANRRHHARIIKAVEKEKWKDIGYKVELSPKISIVTASSVGAILTFKLTIRTPLTEMWRYI